MTTLSDSSRKAIETSIRDARQWEPNAYEIAPIEGWPQEKLALFAVNPKFIASDVAFIYAVLPSGEVLSQFHPENFGKILPIAFPTFSQADAWDIAQLATWFGHSGNPIGRPVRRVPGSVQIPPERWPRRDEAPVVKNDNDAQRLEFYAYNIDDAALYDCRLESAPGSVRFVSEEVK